VDQLSVKGTLEPLFWNDEPVEAVNFPDQKEIVFNTPAWKKKNYLEKDHLAIHELLGLLEITDYQFQVSKEISDLINGEHLSSKKLNCTTYVNGELVQSGLVSMYSGNREPEGSGRAVLHATGSYKVIAETYPLMISVQILSVGEVVKVIDNSAFKVLRQFMQRDIPQTFNKSFEETDFKVTCQEVKPELSE
jgi:hypothetical protein